MMPGGDWSKFTDINIYMLWSICCDYFIPTLIHD